MYRVTFRDTKGFAFAYYSDISRDRCIKYATDAGKNVTWEITYHER